MKHLSRCLLLMIGMLTFASCSLDAQDAVQGNDGDDEIILPPEDRDGDGIPDLPV